MSQAGIRVFLISGFLGSGKTTLLNRMLKEAPQDMNLMILMNEFGEEGIDGTLVEDPELDMIEISRGSIFCACVKGDFIKALYRIGLTLKPEVLVMEASGVANPTDIGRDLFNPVFENSFASLDKFCLLDAENFLEQYEIFVAIEKQIEASDKFIINKMDVADPDNVSRIKEIVLKHNPKATFVETSYADVELSNVFGEAFKGDPAATDKEEQAQLLTEDELEEVVDRILDDEASQVAPPDRLVSMACRWLSGSLESFRKVADKIPPDVVRAKGFVFEDSRPYVYSHVGHKYEIVPYEGAKIIDNPLNRVVFIRREFEEDDIKEAFAEQGIALLP
jgi:G3E family GTPase